MYDPLPMESPVILADGYTPPDISGPVILCAEEQPTEIQLDPVVLSSGYVPPDLSLPVYLCVDVSWLDAEIAGPTLPALALQGTGFQAFIGTLSAPVPVPVLPSLTLEAVATMASSVSANLQIPVAPPVSLTSTLKQNLDLPDKDSASLRPRHSTNWPSTSVSLLFRQQHGQSIALPIDARQQHGTDLIASLRNRHAQMIRFERPITQRHQHGTDLIGVTSMPHAEAIRSRESTRTRHAHGIKRKGVAGLPHAETIKRQPSLRMTEQQALPAVKGLGIGHHNAWPTGTRLEVRWAQGIKPAPGYWYPGWVDTYIPPGFNIVMPCDGSYTPRPLHCEVILGTAYPPQPPCPIEPGEDTIIIPVREAYHVINELTLTELDGTPVAAEDFSASIDADSWTWSWSTRIPASAIAQVRPDSSTRVELIVTINGEPLRVLVENIQRERKFGESWLRVSGRGRAAFLSDPLAPVIQYTNQTAVSAQQALNDTMKQNGIPIGWTLDWQIEDWQIPAGIWSHNGTWIDAAKRIAEAGGAYVQSHDTDQVLHILPRYPVAPWNWPSATPDIQMPEDIVEVEGIEWQEKPDYNAVWIHGGEQGRADRIIIGSTGGTNPAPTIIDELATDPVMTRQRGLALLGDTGKQASISLRLPVLPETGMIRPGTLVEYLEQGNTRRGLVRSLSISHSRPELWQTIGVETHE